MSLIFSFLSSFSLGAIGLKIFIFTLLCLILWQIFSLSDAEITPLKRVGGLILCLLLEGLVGANLLYYFFYY